MTGHTEDPIQDLRAWGATKFGFAEARLQDAVATSISTLIVHRREFLYESRHIETAITTDRPTSPTISAPNDWIGPIDGFDGSSAVFVIEGSEQTVPCHGCRGTGKVACKGCGGNGQVKCPRCDGRGRGCYNCATGFKPCSQCSQGSVRCGKCAFPGILFKWDCVCVSNHLFETHEYWSESDAESIPECLLVSNDLAVIKLGEIPRSGDEASEWARLSMEGYERSRNSDKGIIASSEHFRSGKVTKVTYESYKKSPKTAWIVYADSIQEPLIHAPDLTGLKAAYSSLDLRWKIVAAIAVVAMALAVVIFIL